MRLEIDRWGKISKEDETENALESTDQEKMDELLEKVRKEKEDVEKLKQEEGEDYNGPYDRSGIEYEIKEVRVYPNDGGRRRGRGGRDDGTPG